MTASAKRLVMMFLRRAGVLAAVLTVIAGILGMHVLTGNHSMHSPAAMTATTADPVHAPSRGEDHPVHQVPGGHPTHAASVQDMAGSSAGPCSGNCTSMQTMTVSCTPSAKSGSLTAPLPGTTAFGAVPGAGTAGAFPRLYSYLPGGPSPGELSISRT